MPSSREPNGLMVEKCSGTGLANEMLMEEFGRDRIARRRNHPPAPHGTRIAGRNPLQGDTRPVENSRPGAACPERVKLLMKAVTGIERLRGKLSLD
jgi:hypothetical protein